LKEGSYSSAILLKIFNELAEEEVSIKPLFSYNEHVNSLETDNSKYLVWDKNVIFFQEK
jgi:hypothetical protein